MQKAREALHLGITELHIVGGLHPSLPFSYYTDMLRALRGLDPRLQLKCFTAIEILHLAWLAKKSVAETLRELKAAGLDSLTGGGAEIFRGDVQENVLIDDRRVTFEFALQIRMPEMEVRLIGRLGRRIGITFPTTEPNEPAIRLRVR